MGEEDALCSLPLPPSARRPFPVGAEAKGRDLAGDALLPSDAVAQINHAAGFLEQRALDVDSRRRRAAVEAHAVAEEDRREVDDDLVDESSVQAMRATFAPKISTFFPPAASRAVATASSTPETNVAFGSAGASCR